MALRTTPDLDAYLAHVQAAPADGGRVELIVRRPAVDQREVLAEAVLEPDGGLLGDSWIARGSGSTADGSADPEVQLTLISVRVLEAFEPDRSRWPLAGDQVYVDLDLSVERLPAGPGWRSAPPSSRSAGSPTPGAPSSAAGSAALRCAGSIHRPAAPTGCVASTHG